MSTPAPGWLADLAGDEALAPFRTLVSLNLYNGNNPLKGKGGLNLAVNDEWLARVAGLTTLTNLDVANCDVRGPGLKHVATLKNLERLNVTLTPVTDAWLKPLGALAKLRVVSFASAKCTGEGFAHLGNWQAVENLNFHYTPVNDAGLKKSPGCGTWSALKSSTRSSPMRVRHTCPSSPRSVACKSGARRPLVRRSRASWR